jgi:hypothetical protein
MSEFQGSSRIENMISNIVDNGLLTTNRYVALFQLPKTMLDENPNVPNITIRCSNVTIPARNVSTVGYRIYGPARQMPYEILYGGEITLTYVLSSDMRERGFFEKWMNSVISNRDYKGGFYDDFVGTLEVVVLDRSDQLAASFLVEEVYPKTVSDITLANDRENEYMTQEITLVFRKYTSLFFTKQYPEYNGGDSPALRSRIPKNNGGGLGIASFFTDVRQGIGEGIGNLFTPKSS